ncbi:TetR/AcrR family transcriptional regulator [Streptomyces odontomachi]|uniref:TetR/AcrR family transcriptional regulator n=1 Tax=Streptomyces odontomachi TaxID=2944940 RepID=UPI00210A7D0D|nr:TetR/AcrR family transcriptional regulator [Streptomyces sp. ODS25]
MTQGRRERADAARNRRAILLATEDLLTRHRPEEISMERVAAAAGVGKGTLFHRFGSRMGLMRALMEERAVALHTSVESGPPPLGPGAPPRERLYAFLDGIVDVVSRNKGLVAALGHAASTAHRPPARKTGRQDRTGTAAEEADQGQEPEQVCAVPRGRAAQEPDDTSDAPDRHGHPHDHPVYDFWHAHISALITAERPDADAELLAHLLLSPLYSTHIHAALERGEGARVARALRTTAGAMLDAPETPEETPPSG